jgi:hypothetical protein
MKTSFEVEYYNSNQAVRTKVVEVTSDTGIDPETLIPFALRKLDKQFSKVKRIKRIGANNDMPSL